MIQVLIDAIKIAIANYEERSTTNVSIHQYI